MGFKAYRSLLIVIIAALFITAAVLLTNKHKANTQADSVTHQSYPDNLNADVLQVKSLTQKERCQDFVRDSKINRNIVYNVFNNPLSPALVTMVTQMSPDRLNALAQLALYWNGSISVSVYSTNQSYARFRLEYENSSILRHRNNIYVHFISAVGTHYPTNFLRNTALEFPTNSKYVFLNDIDFVPAPNLAQVISEQVNKRSAAVLNEEQTTFIVAAFELHNHKDGVRTPRDKQELMKMLQLGNISSFLSSNVTQGHEPTNFTRWLNARQIYEVAYEEHFEPYLIIERSKTPRYQQRFVGRYYDKESHILHLHYLGYKFFVLPNTFIVHLPHTLNLKQHQKYFRCAKVEYKRFKQELKSLKFRFKRE